MESIMRKHDHILMLSTAVLLVILSAVKPYSYKYWFANASPSILGIILLLVFYKKFKFTNLSYFLILISILILSIAGHYTYERMPLFTWMQDIFHFGRNHYDRVGHFYFGIAVAIIAREVLLRKTPLQKGTWLFLLVLSVVMLAAVANEFMEWWLTAYTGDLSYVEIQGDQWDTQWDMFVALLGAVLGLLTLAGYQDKALSKFQVKSDT